MTVHHAWLPPSRFLASRKVHAPADAHAVLDELRAAGAALSTQDDAELVFRTGPTGLGPEGFVVGSAAVTTVSAESPIGLLYGLFHLARNGSGGAHRPAYGRRGRGRGGGGGARPGGGQ